MNEKDTIIGVCVKNANSVLHRLETDLDIDIFQTLVFSVKSLVDRQLYERVTMSTKNHNFPIYCIIRKL